MDAHYDYYQVLFNQEKLTVKLPAVVGKFKYTVRRAFELLFERKYLDRTDYDKWFEFSLQRKNFCGDKIGDPMVFYGRKSFVPITNKYKIAIMSEQAYRNRDSDSSE
jgi:hypothetical protein